MPREANIWRTEPIDALILEILSSKGGTLTDKSLYDALRTLRQDLSINEFNKALMRFEIRGFISVSIVKKNLRNVILLAKSSASERKA